MAPAAREITGETAVLCRFHGDALKDHEQRLRQLEKARWQMAGAAAVAAFLGSLLVRFLPGAG